MMLTLLITLAAATTIHRHSNSMDVPALAPDEEFLFSRASHHAGKYRFAYTDAIRRQVLQALRAPNRDETLQQLVPTVMVAGEKWFDLRGISVHSGELDGEAVLTRICWDDARFVDLDLAGADFSFALLRGATFIRSRLLNACFDQTWLECASFDTCDLKGATFKLARFGDDDAQFSFCRLDNAAFDNSRDLRRIYHGSAIGATFTGAVLRHAQFTQVPLAGTHFDNADLTGADFFESDVSGADFRGALLADANLNFAAANKPPLFGGTRLFHTRLGAIDLAHVDVGSFDWLDGDFHIGEELRADSLGSVPSGPDSALGRAQLYENAEVIYRTLAYAYRRLGYSEEYLQLRFRSLEARRKLLDLRSGSANRIERWWLAAWRAWDGYGTQLGLVFYRYTILVGMFALLYLIGWTVLNRHWAVWSNGNFVGGERTAAPQYAFRRARGWRRGGRFASLILTSLLFSIVSTLTLAERVIDARRIAELFQLRDGRLVPVGLGRVFVGVQSIFGALVFYSIVTRLVLLLPP